MERILTERIPPEGLQKALEIDRRAMAGEGTPEDVLESLAILWPGYFSPHAPAPPMPDMELSIPCYAGTFDSIREQFARGTLEELLPTIQVPSFFVLGADSPIPPEHGLASAALIPGARHEVLAESGHFLWLESPGSVRRALDAVASLA